MRGSVLAIVACALVVGVLGDDDMKEKHKEIFKKCAEEAGVTKEDLHNHKKDEEPETKVKCFHACVAKAEGAMVDGKLNKDKIIEKIPADAPDRERVVEAITKCSEQKADDECETAYLVFKCLRENKALPHPPHHHHHHHHDE
ncbi:general odorant-binding protein 56d-like [Microplitis mediator]|uniref:general odorant-binding protein 56d-like n=1 Tax=Microplitis mediator TaxID=375433 RepID=UPI002557B3A8|nr:general odorant-binding protein 56d-like [Microplitis mediator]